MIDFYAKDKLFRNEIIQFIKDVLNTIEDQKCCLIDPELDPEEDDIYFDLPVAIHFGRYDYGATYVITNVRLENDSVWFNGLSTGDYSDEFSFTAEEMETSALADVADTLQTITKK